MSPYSARPPEERALRNSSGRARRVALGFALVGSYGSADAALDELDRLQRRGRGPDWGIVVMDLGLPGTGGVEATRRPKRELPQVLGLIAAGAKEERTTSKSFSLSKRTRVLMAVRLSGQFDYRIELDGVLAPDM